MKSRIALIFATLLAAVTMVGFQNCGGSFSELPILGALGTSKNNGNGYQGQNNPNFYVANGGRVCDKPHFSRNMMRWAGDTEWEVIRRDCEELKPYEPVESSRIAVSDLAFQIVVADDLVYSIWEDVPMQAFCAVIRDNRGIDRTHPVFALTEIDGAPRANLMYVADGETDVRAIYELPVKIEGDRIEVQYKELQLVITGARRGGSGLLSMKVLVPDTDPAVHAERLNLPVRCFANPGKLNP